MADNNVMAKLAQLEKLLNEVNTNTSAGGSEASVAGGPSAPGPNVGGMSTGMMVCIGLVVALVVALAIGAACYTAKNDRLPFVDCANPSSVRNAQEVEKDKEESKMPAPNIPHTRLASVSDIDDQVMKDMQQEQAKIDEENLEARPQNALMTQGEIKNKLRAARLKDPLRNISIDSTNSRGFANPMLGLRPTSRDLMPKIKSTVPPGVSIPWALERALAGYNDTNESMYRP